MVTGEILHADPSARSIVHAIAVLLESVPERDRIPVGTPNCRPRSAAANWRIETTSRVMANVLRRARIAVAAEAIPGLTVVISPLSVCNDTPLIGVPNPETRGH